MTVTYDGTITVGAELRAQGNLALVFMRVWEQN